MRHDYSYLPAALALLLSLGMLISGGCRERTSETPPAKAAAPATAPTAAADPVEERSWAAPFLTAAKSIDITAASAEPLGRLHLSGLALVGLALAARFLFGTWRDAAFAVGIGLLPSIGAVLLTDFPAVVLLIPGIGLALLAIFLVRILWNWRTGFKAWQAVSTEIENADTGKNSTGQRIKDRFAAAGLAPILDKALTLMETIWTKEKSG